jgi:hypothetical protein
MRFFSRGKVLKCQVEIASKGACALCWIPSQAFFCPSLDEGYLLESDYHTIKGF